MSMKIPGLIETAALRKALHKCGDPKIKDGKSKYFKHVCLFIGLKTATIEQLYKQHLGVLPDPWPAAEYLLMDSHHELKQAGGLTLHHNIKTVVGSENQALDSFLRVGKLLDKGAIADWATSDTISGRVLGAGLKKHTSSAALLKVLHEWSLSANLWKRRASAVAFVKVASPKYPFKKDILEICNSAVSGEVGKERFVQLGVGWVVREVGVHDREAAINFIETRYSVISREGLRYSLEKMPSEIRARLLKFVPAPVEAESKLIKSKPISVCKSKKRKADAIDPVEGSNERKRSHERSR